MIEINRHLRKHIEMERLFGVDFLPISKSDLKAQMIEPAKPEEKVKLDWGRMRDETVAEGRS